jgi:hypothetical protein
LRNTGQRAGAVCRATDAKVRFRILAEPFADTGTGRLMLPVPDGLSDVERDLISIRTAEGGSRAKAPGKHIGGPFLAHRPSGKRPPDVARGAWTASWLPSGQEETGRGNIGPRFAHLATPGSTTPSEFLLGAHSEHLTATFWRLS